MVKINKYILIFLLFLFPSIVFGLCGTDRFTDNANGTVTDTKTGLIWLKNASCWGELRFGAGLIESKALGHGNCGLTDNSTACDWRMPTREELQGLNTNPLTSWTSGFPSNGWKRATTPFVNVKLDYYWTQIVLELNVPKTRILNLTSGYIYNTLNHRTEYHYVWPVKRNTE